MAAKPLQGADMGWEEESSKEGQVILFPGAVGSQVLASGGGRTNVDATSSVAGTAPNVEPSTTRMPGARGMPKSWVVVLALATGVVGGTGLSVWRLSSTDTGATGSGAPSITAPAALEAAGRPNQEAAPVSPLTGARSEPRPATAAPGPPDSTAAVTSPPRVAGRAGAAVPSRPTSVQRRATAPASTTQPTPVGGGIGSPPGPSVERPRPTTAAPKSNPPQTQLPQLPPPVVTPDPAPAKGHVALRSAVGGPLGRDVIAHGSLENVDRYACVWIGWTVVVTATDWRASYIKANLPTSGGSFTTETLQLGSEGETDSVWNPIIIAGDSAGCAAITKIVTASSIGEYRGVGWPQGVDKLYVGKEVRRER